MNSLNIFISARICILVFISISAFSCNKSSKNIKPTTISFEKQTHYFGEIPAYKDVFATFYFKNTGENPLIIQKIKTSCGCTVPNWNKEVILPNESGGITVSYDAMKLGRFKTSATIYYNGKGSPKNIFLKGEVEYLSLLE